MTITTKIIADSVSHETGKRITTFELEYPRFIHAEFMTHRLFSRNAASSRAIPIDKMLKMIEENPAMPEVWGKNQSGMQAKEVFSEPWEIATAKWAWKKAAKSAVRFARIAQEMGLHKQIVNRMVEPFSHIKVVLTTTEIENWFWLRDHTDAQPEIHILAQKMRQDFYNSTPIKLKINEWHTPYYGKGYWTKDCPESLQDALAVSSSCSAQVSYRVLDDSLEKALKIFKRLVESTPVHASPFEHQACVGLSKNTMRGDNMKGITHFSYEREMWGSGNFYGWIQYRQLLNDTAKW